ncbi:MAG: M56 family metallopeptidase [Alphaproteobacteria bacterium]
MAHDLMDLALRANLVLAAAIVLALLVRAPMRRLFGARVAYALWLAPPLAAAMCFLPARTLVVTVPDTPSALPFLVTPPPIVAAPAPTVDLPVVLLSVWLGGALLFLALFALRQSRFVRSLGRLVSRRDCGARVFGAESGAGPAVVGALRPVIVTPSDFDRRYSQEERDIVLAHERAHLAQGDPLINAAAMLLQCVCWFNPMVHVAARALRVDQELACDAAVIARAPQIRRLYAEAMLKTHAAPLGGPLVCAWPAPSLKPLKERIAMLKRNPPSRLKLALGASVIAVATVGLCTSAWTAQPPNVVLMKAHVKGAASDDSYMLAQAAPAPAAAPAAATDAEPPVAAEEPAPAADLAGGPDGPDIDMRTFNRDVELLVRDSMRAPRADREVVLTPAQRAQIQLRVQAQAAQIRAQAMHQAQAAVAQARVQVREAQMQAQQEAMQVRAAHDAHQDASTELEAASQQLREHALELAQAAMAQGDAMSESERAAREAEIEREAQRVSELAMQTAQMALAHVDLNEHGQHGPHADHDSH